MKKSLPEPLCGVVPPMITPLADEYSLDLPGLKKLIEHILLVAFMVYFCLELPEKAPV